MSKNILHKKTNKKHNKIIRSLTKIKIKLKWTEIK